MKQVNKNHYNFLKYVTKKRFMSYYYQLKYIYDINPKSILEIGAGNNFLKNSLKDNYDIKVLDIDPELKPDLIGSVDNIPIKNQSFDVICCFQVLEHLPFDKFERALSELRRVSKKYVLISLPYSKLECKINIKLPLIPEFISYHSFPQFYKKHNFDGHHYWEIGKRNYSKKKIIKIIKKLFIIEEVINPHESPYHLFFKLKKKI